MKVFLLCGVPEVDILGVIIAGSLNKWMQMLVQMLVLKMRWM